MFSFKPLKALFERINKNADAVGSLFNIIAKTIPVEGKIGCFLRQAGVGNEFPGCGFYSVALNQNIKENTENDKNDHNRFKKSMHALIPFNLSQTKYKPNNVFLQPLRLLQTCNPHLSK